MSPIQGIRAAYTDALTSVGADAADAQEIARRLGIHKLLAWRLSKIVTTIDAATPMRQMPLTTVLFLSYPLMTRWGRRVCLVRRQGLRRSPPTHSP